MLFIRSQRKGGKDTPVFDIFLRIHSLERQNIPLEEIVISEEEENEIKEIARDSGVYDLLTPEHCTVHLRHESRQGIPDAAVVRW